MAAPHGTFSQRFLSRRRLLGGAAGAVMTALLPRHQSQPAGAADGGDGGSQPTPIPGGVRDAHFYAPGPAALVSTIADFSGFVGVADLSGTGTGYMADGTSSPLTFRIDNRFMVGRYVATDGQTYSGAFAEL